MTSPAAINRSGPLWLERWGRAQTMAKCDEGLSFATEQAAKDPANPQWQSDLALACENKGDVLLAVNHDTSGALQQYRRAQTMREELVRNRSDNAEWNLDLLRSKFKIGQALDPRTGLVSGEPWFEEAKNTAKRAWRGNAEEFQRIVGLLKLPPWAKEWIIGPLEVYRDSQETAMKLAQKNPSNFQSQNDLAGITLRLGDMQFYAGADSDALTNYLYALDITRQLAGNDTNNTEVQYRLAICQAKVAVAHIRLSKPDEAAKEIRMALDVLRPMAERWPGNFVLWEGQRAGGRNFRRKEPTDIKQLRKVLAAFETTLKMVRTEDLKDPTNLSLKEEWGRACSDLVVSKLILGDFSAAMFDEGKAMAVWQELWQAAPNNTLYKTRLERAYVALGVFQLINHQSQAAIETSLRGQALDSSMQEFKAILVLGYVFAGHVEKARAIILENKDNHLWYEQTFGEAIQDELWEFNANGWTEPGIKEALDLFGHGKDPM